MSDRILLVGATGFLGSFVARRLAVRGAAALVRSSSNVAALPDAMELVRGDLNAPAWRDASANAMIATGEE